MRQKLDLESETDFDELLTQQVQAKKKKKKEPLAAKLRR